jgi:hypothetical protein
MARMALGLKDLDLGETGKFWRGKFAPDRFLYRGKDNQEGQAVVLK